MHAPERVKLTVQCRGGFNFEKATQCNTHTTVELII